MSGNPSGRVRRSINQESRQLKSLVTEFIQGQAENIDELYESLDQKQKMNFLLKLIDFVLP